MYLVILPCISIIYQFNYERNKYEFLLLRKIKINNNIIVLFNNGLNYNILVI